MENDLEPVIDEAELFDLLLFEAELDRPFIDLKEQSLKSELLLYRKAHERTSNS